MAESKKRSSTKRKAATTKKPAAKKKAAKKRLGRPSVNGVTADGPQLSLRISVAMTEQIDSVRGDESRSRWVRAAIARELARLMRRRKV